MFYKSIRNRYILVIDILLCMLSYMLSIAFVFPVSHFSTYFTEGLLLISITTVIYVVMAYFFRIYNTSWIYTGAKEYFILLLSCFLSAAMSIILGLFVATDVIFPKLNIISNFFISTMICGLRFAIRLSYKMYLIKGSTKGKRILIIGAGRLAVMLLRDIEENQKLNYNVIGLIDDDPIKQKQHIYNTSVIGTRNDIERICKEEKIEEIIFAIYTLSSKQRTEILDICSRTGKKVKILPGVEASLSGNASIKQVREIKIDDLLERDPIKLDNKLIADEINDKVVLVTGGGGSIGSELCRQIIKYGPKKLVIVDIYENTTYELQNELEEKYPDEDIDVLIASVRDQKRLDEIFLQYKPNIVFHAAAHKHVPLMEYSPQEAIKNNVFGTLNTAECASRHGTKRFVMISTDKAVNPTNIMGASKRMCEMIVQTLQKQGATEFVAVRFGNVLGSHGSVVPRFTKQIEEGGPVTVTHPEITRFFMTIPEAAQLVLQAAAYAKGGEIFVLDMGEPVKIYDLAKKMISLSGYKVGEDINIVFTGLRAGEKLYEELLMNEEGLTKTAHSKIFVGQPIDLSMEELEEKLDKLRAALCEEDADFKKIMADVVPTYQYSVTKKAEIQDGKIVEAV